MEEIVGTLTLEDIIDDISEIITDTRTLREDELTMAMIKKRSNASWGAIRSHLDRFVQAGVLQTREVRLGGRPKIAYSPIEGHTWNEVLKK